MAERPNIEKDEVLKNQYEALINARNFHYENFNKWLMSFYLIIGALFIALYTLHTDEVQHRHMELLVTIVGYVVSLATYLSGKGYYYWEINWIRLVQYFEKTYLKVNKTAGEKADTEEKFRYRVYSVFANKNEYKCICRPMSGANISTSKVALLVTLFVTVLWGMMAFYFVLTLWPCDVIDTRLEKVEFSLLLSAVVTIVLILIVSLLGMLERFDFHCLNSNLEGLDDLELPKDRKL